MQSGHRQTLNVSFLKALTLQENVTNAGFIIRIDDGCRSNNQGAVCLFFVSGSWDEAESIDKQGLREAHSCLFYLKIKIGTEKCC